MIISETKKENKLLNAKNEDPKKPRQEASSHSEIQDRPARVQKSGPAGNSLFSSLRNAAPSLSPPHLMSSSVH